MNKLESTFKEYLEVFHKTLSETAKEYLQTDEYNRLLHLSFLPAQIVGYVSTQFGIGFEYIPSQETDIKIVIGGSRIEKLFLKTPRYYKIEGVMFKFGSFTLDNVDTDGIFPFEMNKDSRIIIKNSHFKVINKKRVVYAELYGDSELKTWSQENAISRAKDEVLAALVELNRSQDKKITLDRYISEYKEKTVLLLGDYDEAGFQRLQSIASKLKKYGYEPLIIKDVPDHPHQDISQKVNAIGAISRFIVVDDSSKSGHLTEIEICKRNNWITILLRADGKGGTWMTAGASVFSSVILEKNYSLDSLETDLLEATKWAEKTIKEIEKDFSNIYPWRK